MKLRPCQQSDIPDMVTIFMECGKTDVLGRYLYPEMEKYPFSTRLGHLRALTGMLLAPGSIAFVVESEPSDHPRQEIWRAPQILGFALYFRNGKSDKAQEWFAPKQTLSFKFNRGLTWLEDKYYQWFTGAHPAWNAANAARIMAKLRKPWDPEIFIEYWYLDLLMIDPKWQRRGIGRMLMNKGFELAQEEKLPVLLKSSPIGGRTYRAVGFKAFENIGLAEFYDELQYGGEPSYRWVWEPVLEDGDGVEGKWYERAKAKADSQLTTEEAKTA